MARNYDVASSRFQELNCFQYFTEEEIADYMNSLQGSQSSDSNISSEQDNDTSIQMNTEQCLTPPDANGEIHVVPCDGQEDIAVGEDLENYAQEDMENHAQENMEGGAGDSKDEDLNENIVEQDTKEDENSMGQNFVLE
ncbi:MAG: hypothetical protein GXP45_02530 [bacterium]|nr:hypothetical protein [bacterium]